jgi:ribosomal protein S18 acetylase RimI-like enzyme
MVAVMGRSNEEFAMGHSPYHVYTYSKGDSYTVNAKHRASGNVIGNLVWSGPTGEVNNVEVMPEHRRNGVATMMWQEAKRYATDNEVVTPKHSPDQSDEGKEWAKKVGD